LKRVASVLDAASIDYMVTGAIASSLYGEPRATHDIDLVIELVPERLPELLAAFPRPEFYLSETAAREALRFGGTFNLIETAESEKVDFWLLTDDPFDRVRFSRKRVEELFGMQLKFSSPEDTILQKLKWSSLSGGSEKAFIDALRVYEVQQGALDLAYLDEWAMRIGVQDDWHRLTAEAEPI
jgi:hypothetical protein